MTETSQPTALRRLGGMELYSSTRHHLGIYRSVVVSARYQIPQQGLDPVPAVERALAIVVWDQPSLHVGILGEDTSAATFSHITEVDLRKHVEWRHADTGTLEAYEAEVARTQGWLHDQRFEEIETRSPWRVVCLRPLQQSVAEAVTPNGFIDVFFSYHHGVADGTGGREFHQHLLTALQTPFDGDSTANQHILSFPDPPKLPENQEEIVPFRNGYLFLLRAVWAAVGPSFLKARKTPAWGGVDIDFSLPYVTRVKPLTVEGDALKSLLAASRKNGCTITTTLHGVVLSSLALRLSDKEATSFACSTPISLRPWVKSPSADPELKDKLRVCLTSHATNHPPAILKALRKPGADVDALVWEAGRRIKADLKKRTDTLPNDDGAGLLPLIKDYMDFWRQKDGQSRDSSWEISNIGVVTVPTKTGDASAWKHLGAIFSNGAMVTGAVIGVNVISVAGGTLTVALTWQEAAVSEEIIEGLAADIINFVERVHKAQGSDK